jgi:hypothetical protein
LNEASFSVSHGGIDMDSMQLASAVAKDLNLEMMKFEREVRPRSAQVSFYENNQSLFYLATRAHGNAIIRIPDLLVEEFYHTSVNEVCCSDIEWPNEAFYLSFEPPEPILLAEVLPIVWTVLMGFLDINFPSKGA